MGKFAVFSGFLGSGKTTAMMALTRYCTEQYGKAAMISNDLGRGVTLADHRLAKLSGLNAAEITEDCICYRKEDLAKRLEAYDREGCVLVISAVFRPLSFASRWSARVTPRPRSLEIMAALP